MVSFDGSCWVIVPGTIGEYLADWLAPTIRTDSAAKAAPAQSRSGDLVLFNRKGSGNDDARHAMQASLVEMLLDADELERKRLLLMALQTGELRKSEAAELLRLVERLEEVSGRTRTPTDSPSHY
jgi:hypothetical protein